MKRSRKVPTRVRLDAEIVFDGETRVRVNIDRSFSARQPSKKDVVAYLRELADGIEKGGVLPPGVEVWTRNDRKKKAGRR
jgi:hypothetical protein